VTSRVEHAGNTARRPAAFWSPAVHDLLRYLETAGFPAPRVLDNQGDTEVLTWIDGESGPAGWAAPLRYRLRAGIHGTIPRRRGMHPLAAHRRRPGSARGISTNSGPGSGGLSHSPSEPRTKGRPAPPSATLLAGHEAPTLGGNEHQQPSANHAGTKVGARTHLQVAAERSEVADGAGESWRPAVPLFGIWEDRSLAAPSRWSPGRPLADISSSVPVVVVEPCQPSGGRRGKSLRERRPSFTMTGCRWPRG
jgi:hypothetical protein